MSASLEKAIITIDNITNAQRITSTKKVAVFYGGIYLNIIFLPLITMGFLVARSYPIEEYKCTDPYEASGKTIAMNTQDFNTGMAGLMFANLLMYWLYLSGVSISDSVNDKWYQIFTTFSIIISVILTCVIFFFSVCGIAILAYTHSNCVAEHGGDEIQGMFQITIANIVYGMVIQGFIIAFLQVFIQGIGQYEG